MSVARLLSVSYGHLVGIVIIYSLAACFTQIGTRGIEIYWRSNIETIGTIITPSRKLISQSHIIFKKQERNFKQFKQSNARNELSLYCRVFFGVSNMERREPTLWDHLPSLFSLPVPLLSGDSPLSGGR